MTEQRTPDRMIRCALQPGFFEWMRDHPVSLAVTTYQAGKLLFIGWNGATVSLHAKNFSKAMGLDVTDDGCLALATLDEIRLFRNDPLLAPDCNPKKPDFYDALFLPRVSYFTGNLFAHDLAFVNDEIWFVNTRFSCLATADSRYGFVPRWQPQFISELAPEDRCHLNGLALRDGAPSVVTALGRGDSPGSWRDNKHAGGILIDIESQDILLDGLTMPHSPRWHKNRLWLLNSGQGELLMLKAPGQAETICKLPAYLRGLAFFGDYAFVGLCKIREKQTFGGMPVEQTVDRLLCGVAIVDLMRRECIGIFEFTDGVDEIYDIRVLEGIRQPNLFLWEEDPATEAITAPAFSYWVREQPPPADAATLTGAS